MSKTFLGLNHWGDAQKVRALQTLRDRIAELAGDDEQAIKDTLEGEVDLEGFLTHLLQEAMVAHAQADGIGKLISDLQERRISFATRYQDYKNLLCAALGAAGEKTWRTAIATVSARVSLGSATITDQSKLGADYWTVEPNVALVREHLLKGEKVEGAKLEDGKPYVTITVKRPRKTEHVVGSGAEPELEEAAQ